MKFHLRLALATGALALALAPAMALAGGPPSSVPPANKGTEHSHATEDSKGTEHLPEPTPGAGASLPAKAKAYGWHCRAESRKHVAGMRGTPFAQCVTAMAKLANEAVSNPRTACRKESKRHVKGEKGTPFSRCVVAGAKLLREMNQ